MPEVENENPVENAGEATPNMQEQPQEEPQPDQGDQSPDQQNGPAVKTPEQLLRELQQQQQQQQNQSGPPGAPGPATAINCIVDSHSMRIASRATSLPRLPVMK